MTFRQHEAAEMTSSGPGSRRLRFDLPGSRWDDGPNFGTAADWRPAPVSSAAVAEPDTGLSQAIRRTRDYLLAEQHENGYWVGELEGDTILESEYILLMAYLGRESSDTARRAAEYMLTQQLPDGGWAIYPGGPLEISASVKAYFALKVTGHSPDAESMLRARDAILAAGGAEGVNSFTRFYLALLGVIGYHQCPAVPPELMLIPRWLPFNIYEKSARSRTILIPLSIMWAYRPVRQVPEEWKIAELFVDSPEELPVCMPPCEALDPLRKRRWINWRAVFTKIDRGLKLLDRLRVRPLRGVAVRKAERWMHERFENSDGLGAIFPPIIWSIVALRCLGHGDDSPVFQQQMDELHKLCVDDGKTVKLQPCTSPVWDTAIAAIATREAGVAAEHPSLRRAVDWLLSKEVREKHDWAVRNVGHEAGGWFFEFDNEFYPDVDDTCMVVMALKRCLPAPRIANLNADFLLGDWSPHAEDRDAVAVVSGRIDTEAGGRRSDVGGRRSEIGDQNSPPLTPHHSPLTTYHLNFDALRPQLTAIWRGARWILAMQNRDGGWGAFDRDNDREVFTQVPFADHNAMIDPSSADLTARMLEMFADLNVTAELPSARRALDYVWKAQEPDGSWYGRWGVNYIYGTWQALVGLAAIGIPLDDERIRQAAEWLKSVQQANGGWGESPRSYDQPELKGRGPTTASQTAWAIMGLMAAGETPSDAVRSGVQYLLNTQKSDGTWDEPWFTGTGFARVFYLKYHLYRIYFPLMALARYARQSQAAAGKSSTG
jgi:squalene-hopene/tetraprenyl-beta-curcumene cyclase